MGLCGFDTFAHIWPDLPLGNPREGGNAWNVVSRNAAPLRHGRRDNSEMFSELRDRGFFEDRLKRWPVPGVL